MLFFARLGIAGLCEYFNNLRPIGIWYRSIVKILTRVDWCHIMIDNTRYISLLAASIYNTCYISRACTSLSINASICLACITRVIHPLMHASVWLEAPRVRAFVNACASLSMRRGRHRRNGCARWAMPTALLVFALSIALTITHCIHEWMEAPPRLPHDELDRWLHDIVNILTRLAPIAGGATYWLSMIIIALMVTY